MKQASGSAGSRRKGLRWAFALLFLLAAPCFLVLGLVLIFSWTAEPHAVAVGTVKLLMTLGLLSLAMAPASVVGAGYLIWTACRKARPA